MEGNNIKLTTHIYHIYRKKKIYSETRTPEHEIRKNDGTETEKKPI